MDKSLILNEIKKLHGIKSDAKFADILGISPQNLRNWRTRNTYDPNLLLVRFTNVNAEWLLTGEGEPLKTDTSTAIAKTEHSPQAGVPVGQFVPVYDLAPTAGKTGSFIGRRQKPREQIYIPNLSSCDGAAFIRGDRAMEPLISPGDLVLFKQFSTLRPDVIRGGDIYLIAFSGDFGHQMVISYARNAGDSGNVTLGYFNPDYKPQDIPFSSITAIAKVKAFVKYTSMS